MLSRIILALPLVAADYYVGEETDPNNIEQIYFDKAIAHAQVDTDWQVDGHDLLVDAMDTGDLTNFRLARQVLSDMSTRHTESAILKLSTPDKNFYEIEGLDRIEFDAMLEGGLNDAELQRLAELIDTNVNMLEFHVTPDWYVDAVNQAGLDANQAALDANQATLDAANQVGVDTQLAYAEPIEAPELLSETFKVEIEDISDVDTSGWNPQDPMASLSWVIAAVVGFLVLGSCYLAYKYRGSCSKTPKDETYSQKDGDYNYPTKLRRRLECSNLKIQNLEVGAGLDLQAIEQGSDENVVFQILILLPFMVIGYIVYRKVFTEKPKATRHFIVKKAAMELRYMK